VIVVVLLAVTLAIARRRACPVQERAPMSARCEASPLYQANSRFTLEMKPVDD
jgi:hypothetical protein